MWHFRSGPGPLHNLQAIEGIKYRMSSRKHIDFRGEFTRNKAIIRPFLIFTSRWLAPHFVLARPRSGVEHGKFLIYNVR